MRVMTFNALTQEEELRTLDARREVLLRKIAAFNSRDGGVAMDFCVNLFEVHVFFFLFL